MKWTGCWTWVFCTDVRRIVEKNLDGPTGLFLFLGHVTAQRSNVWPRGCCVIPLWWKSACRRSPAETVTHAVYPVAAEQKFDLLMALLERTNFDSALIFCRTKYGADRIRAPIEAGESTLSRCIAFEPGRSGKRIEALEGFKSGQIRSDGGDRYCLARTRHRQV